MHYLSLVSTIVTFAFAVAVFYRYAHRKGSHLLMWGIGLIFYGLGTLTEVVLGLTDSIFALRVWYLSGAMLTAAWLGQGTIFLLIRRRGIATALTLVLAVVSVVSALLVFVAPVNSAAPFDVSQPISIQYKEILERTGMMILLTVLLNIYGTVALVGGAIYSAYLFWRKNVLFQRMLGNVLIAGGALMPAMAGSLLKAGLGDWLYLSELVGVILMFSGFLLATAGKPAERRAVASTART